MRYQNWTASAAGLALMLLAGGMPAEAAWDKVSPARSESRSVHAEGYLVAQVTDPRVMALEEQVRSLSGQVEELNFLLLQLQEQMRKMQEDNEYRFQQLEGGSNTPQQRSDAPPTEDRAQAPLDSAPADAPAAGDSASAPPATGPGEPPRNLGAIVLNPDGSVKDVTLGEPMDLRGPSAPAAGGSPATDDTTVAALPQTSDPELLYGDSYEFILSGDYKTAEAGFRRHIEQFPTDPRTADARYWLGEALFSQGRHAEAAEVFLNASRDFPQSGKAPDMLLKLGISLAAMDQKEVACATFREAQSRFPDASNALQERVRQEAALAGC